MSMSVAEILTQHVTLELECIDRIFLNVYIPRLQSPGLTAERIERLAHKWLAIAPRPLSAADRAAEYDYQLSVLQAEFSLTQVLDAPLTGRLFFEQSSARTSTWAGPTRSRSSSVGASCAAAPARPPALPHPGHHRSREPSVHVYYRSSSIKQYHKEGRALRTETTINDAGDFAIGKRLTCLAAPRQAGFHANRRLLAVQRISADCTIGEERTASCRARCSRRSTLLPEDLTHSHRISGFKPFS